MFPKHFKKPGGSGNKAKTTIPSQLSMSIRILPGFCDCLTLF